eukprot:9403522-Lingulodinium_polyedra.AAC.1
MPSKQLARRNPATPRETPDIKHKITRAQSARWPNAAENLANARTLQQCGFLAPTRAAIYPPPAQQTNTPG